jgi:parallel beta-helix repeat protein
VIATTLDDSAGISASSNTTAGGGTIQGNKVSDCAASAFSLGTVYNLQVLSNSAVRCTQDSRGAFTVTGDGNTLLKNLSTESDNKGFIISGNGNTVTSCVAKNALADGFRVSSGTGNTFTSCVATGCGGEGFDNRGTGTVLQGGTFLKNRIDIANDAIGGATIPGGLATVKFKTGDALTQPEVD